MTQARPIADAATSEQQRFELELLLQQAVPTAQELEQGGSLLSSHPLGLEPSRWQSMQALPLAIDDRSVSLAVPSHWGDAERQMVQEQLTIDGRSIQWRAALLSDLNPIWDGAQDNESVETEQQPAPDDSGSNDRPISDGSTANDDEESLDKTIASFLDGFTTDGILEEDPEERAIVSNDVADLEASLKDAGASPVIALVDRILIQAMSVGASDIHVEPQQRGLQLRYRQDGVLQQYIEPLPSRLIPAVTSRFKILADLDIAERRQAQDGRIRRKYRDRVIDFRVNTLPSRFGEKVCLRLLDSSATQLGLDKLISNHQALNLVRDLGSKPFGMILVTGPTGSGKSTTLYSLLAERNDPGINISTVEDPIEYTLPGITQSQVNREKGFDFATALRAFMRQDPDVLLVGETRDLETAKTAIEAALTGHLVLSTLHANDAPSTIARLDEMGVEPFMVAASLIGIVSQRLMRRVCTACREPYHPDERELGRFGLMASSEAKVTFYRAHHHDRSGGKVCPHCKGSGYKGRVGVYEVLRINEEISTAIARGASTDVIRQLALESGMNTLLGYSLELVREGHTTLEEVGRMILTDSGLESERRARALSTMTCTGCGAGLEDGWLECPYCLTPRH